MSGRGWLERVTKRGNLFPFLLKKKLRQGSFKSRPKPKSNKALGSRPTYFLK